MCVVTTFSVPPCGRRAHVLDRRRPFPTRPTDVPCQVGSPAAADAPPNLNIRVCVPASVSSFIASSASQVMCRRPGARITPAAPYALHCSPAASSFAGSQALATRLPSALSGNAGMIALRRSHHPIAPVLSDDGDPIASEIDRRLLFGRCGRSARACPASLRLR